LQQILQTRGHIEYGEVGHYQVVLKAGFTLEGEYP
jgi:flavin-binding protein dodecin